MKNTGIWIDKNKALIVTIEEGEEKINTIMSNIEHFHIGGGSGTRFKGGPQDVVQDSKYLEREKHQLKSFFKEVTNEIGDTDNLVIFGPAQTGEKFSKELHKNNNPLSSKIKGVLKADSITDNQVKALVRGFYKSS